MAQPSLQRRRSTSDFLRLQAQREADRGGSPNWIVNALFSRMQNDLAYQRKIREFSEGLPKLTEQDLVAAEEIDSSCPICLTSFSAILNEEEMALALDTPAHPVEQLGVTRFKDTCGHIFCRKDALSWVNQGRTTCPTCRRPYIDLPNAPEIPQFIPGESPGFVRREDGSMHFDISEYATAAASVMLPGIHSLRDQGIDPEALLAQVQEAQRREDREQEFSGMYS
ncbi:hypothetical protein DAEQUDRAFT_754224 [Daedalea quercina L-15889]|uniref:RING-type domain-containing protein n=1 Tax=Daedalea quercina L-15889 TaxID=1314783 RepID=A0A165TQC7_9APHY|nr:hypothetical protein DAEQUDRAFT_754224 [Daedalea quercina L-15889]